VLKTPNAEARALYLGHGEHKRVSCTEAALVVSNARGQIYRYPIGRVARVVSSLCVDWSGAALALCMQQAIAIAWLDTHGAVTGCLYPQQDRDLSFHTALELMLETPDGLQLYQHWLRSRRMQVMAQWAKTAPTPIPPHAWENTKREWVYGATIRNHLPEGLRGHCLAWVAAQLQENALPPLLWSPHGEAIHLDENLTHLLWAEMNLCCGAITEAAKTSQELTHLFEHWRTRNGCALLLHLSSLQRTAMKAAYTP
jgi:hypothetical protein